MSVFMCDMLDQCSIEVFTVQTYELLRTYIYIHTYMFINNFLMDGMNVVNEASPQTQRLRWMLSETIDILSKFYLTVHWRISYTQSSFSFWVHPLFCIKVRGQHLYLAVTERSSSHPKTNKYRGSVWLFLALITNYNRLYSWKLVKILLTPFWSHFSYPQCRILSPFSKIAFKVWKIGIFAIFPKGLRILDCG